MFTHVMVGSTDLERSKAFYNKVLGTLGYGAPFDDGNRFFYMLSNGAFGVTLPIDGQPATFANGGTIGFAATSPEQADAWHAAGIAAGGTSIEDPPGWREGGMGKMYLAYLRDPDGNKLCVMHRGA
ncbi:VOC family protein [Zavarzinia sp. CC-PAN008]|uniref:VOC family protein n=1 Tax=Zavarzinia sp. CC-PAN008 TaxID=3243332 RepID=UPI003F742962